MNSRAKAWILAAIVMVSLFLGMAQGAQASRLKTPLPPTKTPNSARFDFNGSITINSSTAGMENVTIEMVGNGAFTQDALQMDLTIKAPEGVTGGSSNDITFSTIVIDDKLYFKMVGVSPETDDQWYVSDLSAMAGAQGTLPGMPTSDPASVEEAYTTTQVGKEAINGAPTTKYRIDVDFMKLYVLMGYPQEEAAKLAENLNMVMFMWVGDNDMYVHRMSLSADMTVPEADLSMSMEFTITYKDFDTPITITAPPNAQPLDITSTTSILPGGTVPIGMPIGMPVGMPTGTGMGMPRTGAGNQPSVPWAFIPVGVALIVAGCMARRRGHGLAKVSS